MRRIITLGPSLIVLATASSLLWFAPHILRALAASQTEAKILLARRTIETDDILERLNRAIRAVADSVEPSVVHIDVMSRESGRRQSFGSTGSGWIYDASGHIVTNAHVVRGARFVRVQLYDGRASQATIVGIDPFTDIAVIKVDASDVTPVQRATGERVHQGDRVFAFGSPFGFKFSMSEGIVSGLGRAAGPALESGGFTNFIQTDAAVNPGNSGGPLVDVKGRVVGMNVAIATARDSQGIDAGEGQSSGISFAIPLVTIENVVRQLIDSGKVSRGFLGVSFSFDRFFDENGSRLGVPVGVADEGPASRAGIQSGDIITSMNGQDVTSREVLRSLISNSKPGDSVKLAFRRGDDTRDASVTMGEMPTDVLIRTAVIADLEDDLGIVFDTPDNSRFFRGQDAPYIKSVQEGSIAQEAKLRELDRIVKVGDREVVTISAAVAAMIDQGIYMGRPVTIVTRATDEQPSPERTHVFRLWDSPASAR